MIPTDWTIHDATSPDLSLAGQVSVPSMGRVMLRVRYLDVRTGEELELAREAATLADCIHEVGVAVREGFDGQPGRPGTANAVTELLCRYVNQNRARIDEALGRG